MSEFLHMGGYAAFVWPAYALSIVTLIGLTIFIKQRTGRAKKRLQLLESTRQKTEHRTPTSQSNASHKSSAI